MVWLGEISYEIFLLHVVVMALVVGVVLHWPLFTGSIAVLYVVTLAITIPLAMRAAAADQTEHPGLGAAARLDLRVRRVTLVVSGFAHGEGGRPLFGRDVHGGRRKHRSEVVQRYHLG